MQVSSRDQLLDKLEACAKSLSSVPLSAHHHSNISAALHKIKEATEEFRAIAQSKRNRVACSSFNSLNVAQKRVINTHLAIAVRPAVSGLSLRQQRTKIILVGRLKACTKVL